MSETEKPLIDKPAEAVADAMMVAQAEFLAEYLENPAIYQRKPQDESKLLEEILQGQTSGNCMIGTIFALHYLGVKYPHLFEAAGRLVTFDNPDRVSGTLKSQDKVHAYFMVKDINGVWYAGSPANHIVNSENSPLTRVISSTDPQEVVDRITEIDGGEWPDGKFIEKAFEKEGYQPVVFTRDSQNREVLNIVEITNLFGKNLVRTIILPKITDNLLFIHSNKDNPH